MACLPSSCCTVVNYLCLAVVFLYLVVCVLLVPQYRFVALLVFALVALYATSAWRFLPSERFTVRERAEAMARGRCPPTPTQ